MVALVTSSALLRRLQRVNCLDFYFFLYRKFLPTGARRVCAFNIWFAGVESPNRSAKYSITKRNMSKQTLTVWYTFIILLVFVLILYTWFKLGNWVFFALMSSGCWNNAFKLFGTCCDVTVIWLGGGGPLNRAKANLWLTKLERFAFWTNNNHYVNKLVFVFFLILTNSCSSLYNI